ncbi:alpha/beta hydrolase [Luteimonas sp. 50]|uniref:Alpha/beta hydrolase n=1 Tax=Cognatiluteimonas sedimenti TaxID=2927791 RepID=A0ABT0A6E5_9GAMM|nr:alpha/beta hydrolase [Lysobacter sedimenti]MCJ0826560.1 alpha/beta hydrolase [Lysobacter sedimenti]
MQRPVRSAATALMATLLCWAALAACTGQSVPEDVGPVATPVTPMPKGHGIGRVPVAWTDATRTEHATASGRRELRGLLYYPAAQAVADGGRALDAAWADAYRPSLVRRIGPRAADAVLQMRWHAGAGIAAAEGRFPVLVFAHGYHQLPTSYTTLIESLVARGYAVFAIAAPGIAEVVPLGDGRIAPNLPLGDDGYSKFAQDIASAVAELPKLDATPGHPFSGHLDSGRIGVFGHSVGGAAAVLASARVPAIRAAANLDGDYSGDAAEAQPRVPLLYITTQPPNRAATPKSGWDDERNEVRRAGIWRQLAVASPRALRVRVGGMFHANFQDEALLPASAIPQELRGTRFGSIDGVRGLELTSRLLAGFFAGSLGGPAAEEVDKVVAAYPEADLQVSGSASR